MMILLVGVCIGFALWIVNRFLPVTFFLAMGVFVLVACVGVDALYRPDLILIACAVTEALWKVASKVLRN